jgi:hypothetical protein
LAAKNFIGVTPLSRYAQLIGKTWWNRGALDHSNPQLRQVGLKEFSR